MKYKLPDFDLSEFPVVYVGNRVRYATATAVSFIDDVTILVAVLLSKKIYLININNDEFDILDEITLNHYPDLMDYKDGLIVTSNRTNNDELGCVTILELKNNKIIFIREIISKNNRQIHGIRIIDNENVIITNTSTFEKGCYFMDLKTEKTTKFNQFDFFPKDIFIINNRMLISTSGSRPSGLGEVKITNSKLYLFEFPSMKKIDELEFFGQTDCISFNNQDGFITLQGQDSLFHFKLIDDKLSYVKLIDGFDFPHGVASMNEKVIVTNYGDNSIDILKLSDLV